MRYPYRNPAGYEERLNRQVMGHLHYSLQEGATLLNTMLEDLPVSFGDDASIVAHQYDPLPKSADTEVDREIDWVIRDADTLVGFESKYDASLGSKQLRDELAKLRANADERYVHLVAITRHASAPSLFDEFDGDPVYWTNWFTIATRLERTDERDVPPAQRVPLRMLRDLFEGEDMEPFSGFDHQDKLQYRYFVRDLRTRVDEIDLENRGKLHTWTTESQDPSGGSRIVPEYIGIPFVDEDRPPHNKAGRPKSKRATVPLVVVDTDRHEVYAGIVFGIQKVSRHRKLLLERGNSIAERYHSNGYEMWIGRNSINNTTVPPEKTRDLDEMQAWLSDTGKKVLAHHDEDDNYRNVWFLRGCSQTDLEELFDAIVRTLREQKAWVIDSDEYLEGSSLSDPSTV
ncbi:hypothetical protein [Natrialba sp. INN-245]|uniref:hypothetical protein n=1 Tax=Natrialba sp. INN-245 TaxID=2690967 RepID=UPI00131136D1|nr:hypothetical protein [Natrialba sp. INN-245]MWV40059.1 hypothetical protein [Natrialba sp. INN-245]